MPRHAHGEGARLSHGRRIQRRRRGSPACAAADEAVRIGPPPAQESYLNIEALPAAAKLAGADAVHPGYGFLSENAAFAEACSEAGLPSSARRPAAIDAMGNKARAKALMEAAGVPVVPGYRGADQSDETLIAEGTPYRLPADGQGCGWRWRPRHAAGHGRRGPCRRRWPQPLRSGQRLRLRTS